MNWRQDPTKTFFLGVMMRLLPFVALLAAVLVISL
jgi:hypothetical protein